MQGNSRTGSPAPAVYYLKESVTSFYPSLSEHPYGYEKDCHQTSFGNSLVSLDQLPSTGSYDLERFNDLLG
jgi:hypothetical protein